MVILALGRKTVVVGGSMYLCVWLVVMVLVWENCCWLEKEKGQPQGRERFYIYLNLSSVYEIVRFYQLIIMVFRFKCKDCESLDSVILYRQLYNKYSFILLRKIVC
jgi:hypothetical protein